MSRILLRPIYTDRFFCTVSTLRAFSTSLRWHLYRSTPRYSHGSNAAAPAFGHRSDKRGGWHTGGFLHLDRKILKKPIIFVYWPLDNYRKELYATIVAKTSECPSIMIFQYSIQNETNIGPRLRLGPITRFILDAHIERSIIMLGHYLLCSVVCSVLERRTFRLFARRALQCRVQVF